VAAYQVEKLVALGGMAEVYKARDERLGRLVALKVLAPAWAADTEFRRRFTAESRAAAAVDHPHIIPIYEADEAGGELFIAMRLVTGGDLRQAIAREGPLPPERAAQFLSPVASALDAAHRKGLVHRDVKPGNVLVDAHQERPDHVYLSDFGISKSTASAAWRTKTGLFLGTPAYAAPEQAQSRTVDGRTDQYALACVAWHLLTGTPPFREADELAVLQAHRYAPPPLLALRRPDLPATAGQVLAKAMAKEPGQRYPTCGEFTDTLREALGLPPYRPTVTPAHLRTDISSPPSRTATATITPAPGRYDELADLNRAIELNPGDTFALARRGAAYKAMGRNGDALADFNRAIELDSDYAQVIAFRGDIYREMERYGEALADFNRAIELDPGDAWAIASRGDTYRRKRRARKALADFNRAIELDPGNAHVIARRGETYRMMERLDAALTDLNRAIELNVGDAWVIASRGDTYRMMGWYGEALADFNRAIELDPGNAFAITCRDALYAEMARPRARPRKRRSTG
jgi:tetratricopeptide (TPR) repeat protein